MSLTAADRRDNVSSASPCSNQADADSSVFLLFSRSLASSVGSVVIVVVVVWFTFILQVSSGFSDRKKTNAHCQRWLGRCCSSVGNVFDGSDISNARRSRRRTDRTFNARVQSTSGKTEGESEAVFDGHVRFQDKLTEILRFRSTCRRHHATPQQTSSSSTTNYLKRLQSDAIELSSVHQADVTSTKLTAGAWKASNAQRKSSVSTRHSHHHHQPNLFANGKKRRLPCLLQRLIDEGNLIKEAVHRLKSQRFSPSCYQQQQSNTPSTPTTKSPFPVLTNASLSSASITIPPTLNDSPNQSASWFLSSNVFATGNHACETGPPLRTWMEIGIHDG